MNEHIKKRVLSEASYIIDTNETIRNTAGKFSVSKSTVHTELSKRLARIDQNLKNEIDTILKKHDEIKHIRGGEETKRKYKRG